MNEKIFLFLSLFCVMMILTHSKIVKAKLKEGDGIEKLEICLREDLIKIMERVVENGKANKEQTDYYYKDCDNLIYRVVHHEMIDDIIIKKIINLPEGKFKKLKIEQKKNIVRKFSKKIIEIAFSEKLIKNINRKRKIKFQYLEKETNSVTEIIMTDAKAYLVGFTYSATQDYNAEGYKKALEALYKLKKENGDSREAESVFIDNNERTKEIDHLSILEGLQSGIYNGIKKSRKRKKVTKIT